MNARNVLVMRKMRVNNGNRLAIQKRARALLSDYARRNPPGERRKISLLDVWGTVDSIRTEFKITDYASCNLVWGLVKEMQVTLGRSKA